MAGTPGTVSKILWHFTGGPRWNAAENKQERKPKPAEDAYKALVGILGSRGLRLGGYKEVVSVPRHWSRAVGDGAVVTDYSRIEIKSLESVPVVCLADIPIIHLSYHAQRYGKIAIGFHREHVMEQGFMPVFYQFLDSPILQVIYEAEQTRRSAQTLSKELKPESDYEGAIALKVSEKANTATLCYIKACNHDELETIFCEREWRSTSPFHFEFSDVSMIVVPRDGGYFERLVGDAESLGLPRSVPIVAWEDLVEH